MNCVLKTGRLVYNRSCNERRSYDYAQNDLTCDDRHAGLGHRLV